MHTCAMPHVNRENGRAMNLYGAKCIFWGAPSSEARSHVSMHGSQATLGVLAWDFVSLILLLEGFRVTDAHQGAASVPRLEAPSGVA